ncbi:hypothetical protein GGR55DRAFT_625668 [Xylaria sp. FL0064]|nr:hypothetical protein GGR55DRAFT_625668 [Xylaria sp. FL0064]
MFAFSCFDCLVSSVATTEPMLSCNGQDSRRELCLRSRVLAGEDRVYASISPSRSALSSVDMGDGRSGHGSWVTYDILILYSQRGVKMHVSYKV